MIELFDRDRLLPRRDRTLLAGAMLVSISISGMLVHGSLLQQKLRNAEAQRNSLQQRLQAPAARGQPSPALLADLQLQVRRVEAELAGTLAGADAQAMAGSVWLDRLGQLGSNDISLSRVEIDRAGGARIEGQATTTQAVNNFVQAWGGQDQMQALPARAIEVRQDKNNPPYLRFLLSANPPTPGSGLAAGARPTGAASAASSTVASAAANTAAATANLPAAGAMPVGLPAQPGQPGQNGLAAPAGPADQATRPVSPNQPNLTNQAIQGNQSNQANQSNQTIRATQPAQPAAAAQTPPASPPAPAVQGTRPAPPGQPGPAGQLAPPDAPGGPPR